MELLLNGETSAESPSADFLLRWFGNDHDPAEFLVLRDGALGELRATAPRDGVCLLQTDGSAAAGGPWSPRRAELELSASEAAGLFVQFLSGDPAYRAAFDTAPDRAAFSWVGWLLGVLTVGAGWWAWKVL